MTKQDWRNVRGVYVGSGPFVWTTNGDEAFSSVRSYDVYLTETSAPVRVRARSEQDAIEQANEVMA